MKYNKLIDALATIILFAGMFMAFLPHALHARAGLENSHVEHVVLGIALVILGLGILIYNNRAFRFQK